MKTAMKMCTVDYTEEEIIKMLHEIYSRDLKWLWKYIDSVEKLTKVVNELQNIYWMEEQKVDSERLVMDTIMLITHKNDFLKLLSLVDEKGN